MEWRRIIGKAIDLCGGTKFDTKLGVCVCVFQKLIPFVANRRHHYRPVVGLSHVSCWYCGTLDYFWSWGKVVQIHAIKAYGGVEMYLH
jgi:hypothetical protein